MEQKKTNEVSVMGGRTAKRVLIYRLGSLGDTTIALPCFHLIAKAFPDAKRTLLTNIPAHAKAPAASGILAGSGLIHDYIHYPLGSRNIAELSRNWLAIRRLSPDILIYLAAPRGDRAVRRDELYFRLCGISRIVGLPYGDLGTLQYFPDNGEWESEASRLSRTMAPLGDAKVTDLTSWDLRFTEDEKQKAKDVLASCGSNKFIACGVGTKMQAKDWELDNWQALLKRLADKFADYCLVMVGAKDDSEVSELASPSWNGRKLNLCGTLSPRETAAVLEHAELFLGPDSGPMHLAAAVGVPCAIAFSARGKPGVWFPIGDWHEVVYHKTECFGCNLEVCVENKKKCLLSITTDEMYSAATRAWESGRVARPQ